MTALLEASRLAIPGRLKLTDLQLAAGTVAALIGPNGSGKTSLLRALAGVERTQGLVRVAGQDLGSASPAQRRKLLAFLPAGRELVWPIAAKDVIAMGMERPMPGRIAEVIATLELEPLADRPADRLSTGERARVLMGRALAQRPSVLLFDEPLSNLDPYWSLRMLAVVRQAAEAGAAVLMSLHDLSLLGEFDRAVLMDGGALLLDGPPRQVLDDPCFERVFRVSPAPTGWRLKPLAGPRSSR